MNKFQVLAYGAGKQPFNKGVVMATATDENFAKDIAESMARAFQGQWFSYIKDNGRETPPFRFALVSEYHSLAG
jgi:hypothetical protein